MHNSYLKIRDYEAEDFQQLDVWLLGLSQIVGLTEPPEDKVREYILGFLKDNFSDFSKEEMERAFNMAMAYQLDIPEFKDDKGVQKFRTFNKITPDFISPVLIAYRKHRSQILINVNQKVSAMSQKKLTEVEIDAVMAAGCIFAFNDFTESGDVMDLNNSIFRWLHKRGIIQYDEDEINKIKKQAAKELDADLRRRKSVTDPKSSMYRLLAQSLEELKEGKSNQVSTMARRIALKKWFEKLMDAQETPAKYLSQYIDVDDTTPDQEPEIQ
jgi:hypothetical protein